MVAKAKDPKAGPVTFQRQTGVENPSALLTISGNAQVDATKNILAATLGMERFAAEPTIGLAIATGTQGEQRQLLGPHLVSQETGWIQHM